MESACFTAKCGNSRKSCTVKQTYTLNGIRSGITGYQTYTRDTQISESVNSGNPQCGDTGSVSSGCLSRIADGNNNCGEICQNKKCVNESEQAFDQLPSYCKSSDADFKTCADKLMQGPVCGMK